MNKFYKIIKYMKGDFMPSFCYTKNLFAAIPLIDLILLHFVNDRTSSIYALKKCAVGYSQK